MVELLLVSIIISNAEKVSIIKKNPQEYFSKIGKFDINTSETTNHKISLTGKIDANVLYEGEPIKKAEKIFYKNNINIRFCDHGFLFISTSVLESDYRKIKKNLNTIWPKLEHKIKTIRGLYEIDYSKPKKETVTPIPLVSGTHYKDKDHLDAFDSHIEGRSKRLSINIDDKIRDITKSASFDSKFQRMDYLSDLQKSLQKYSYKLEVRGKSCNLIPESVNKVKTIIDDLLKKIDSETKKIISQKKYVKKGEIGKSELQFIFMDIEGFTKKGIDGKTQMEMVEKLTSAVSEAAKEAKLPLDNCFINATGDGMVIGIQEYDPQPILEFAIHIQKYLHRRETKKGINPKIRIGIESGPVYSFVNLKGDIDYVGPGIIDAHRIMSFGKGGHILMSKSMAKKLIGMDKKYAGNIHEIKKPYKIRQKEEIEICTVYGDNFGNNIQPPHREPLKN